MIEKLRRYDCEDRLYTELASKINEIIDTLQEKEKVFITQKTDTAFLGKGYSIKTCCGNRVISSAGTLTQEQLDGLLCENCHKPMPIDTLFKPSVEGIIDSLKMPKGKIIDVLESSKPSVEYDKETEMKIREYLWLSHGHQGLYGDDEEMQCSACPADYKRDSIKSLIDKVLEVRTKLILGLSLKPSVSSELKKKFNDFTSNRKDIPKEYAELINKNFWDLI